MADLAWTRKYRPSSFDDYIGDDVKKTVMSRFKNRENIPQTIMLYGTRGTGKTSMARLMCKEILCEEPVDGHSCGKCSICEEVNEYITSTEAGIECTGITEVDASSTTGKNDINDIIEEALIPPTFPLTHKVVIFDEVHGLSTSAQNSLLKVIEEPPEHLVFILCTTDPEKVINTIHSRIQLKLEVTKKSVDGMADKLMEIATAEKLETSREALQLIAKKCDRIPRDCIQLLERVAKSSGNRVLIKDVRDAINEVSTEVYMKYYKAANSSLEDILEFNKYLQDNDIEADKFISGLVRFSLDALYVKHGIKLDDFPSEFVNQIKEIFEIYKTSDFDALLQILEVAAKNIGHDSAKNELLITNTAMRIGKINLLANGLSFETERGREENIEAIRKYRDKLEQENVEMIDKLPELEVKKETFAAEFSGMSEVTNSDMVLVSDSEAEEERIEQAKNKISELFNF